jgi:hypothetical protein
MTLPHKLTQWPLALPRWYCWLFPNASMTQIAYVSLVCSPNTCYQHQHSQCCQPNQQPRCFSLGSWFNLILSNLLIEPCLTCFSRSWHCSWLVKSHPKSCPYMLRLAIINALACKQGNFWLTLFANRKALRLTLIATRLKWIANGLANRNIGSN